MGGYGSGRWRRWASRRLAEDCLCIDINWLARRRLLIPACPKNIQWSVCGDRVAWAIIQLGTHPDHPVLFVVLHGHDSQEPDGDEYSIRVELTPQHFGGRRRWLCCCLCSRRVAKLYLPAGEVNWACRSCYGLTYRSSREAHQAERLPVSAARICAKRY